MPRERITRRQKNMIKKYFLSLWQELKREPLPLFPVGVLLVATLTLTLAHDEQILSFIQSKFPVLYRLKVVDFYDLYGFIVLFILPAIYLKMCGKRLRDFGLSLGRVKIALPLFFIFLAILTLVAWWMTTMPVFQNFYGGMDGMNPIHLLISYLVAMWGWEFIHRGFLIQGLRKHVGKLSIFIQLLPFVILHLDKPVLEVYGSLLFGLFAGLYAYISESFVYGVILHTYFAIIIVILL